MLSILSIVAFILYTRILPYRLWTPTFDFASRISSIEELLTLKSLAATAVWLARVLAPVLPFLFLHDRRTLQMSLMITLGAAFNFAAIAISNSLSMHDAYNYYAITPAVLTFVAFVAPVINKKHFYKGLCASLFIASIFGPQIGAWSIIEEAVALPSARSEIRRIVSAEKAVIADGYTTSLLADQRYTLRIFHANKMLPRFDYIVQRKNRRERLSLFLRSWSTVCGKTQRYIIRCGQGKVKASQLQ
jgi:hypothetical protein